MHSYIQHNVKNRNFRVIQDLKQFTKFFHDKNRVNACGYWVFGHFAADESSLLCFQTKKKTFSCGSAAQIELEVIIRQFRKEVVFISKNGLKLGKELQANRKRMCKLYRARYNGCRCYAVLHTLSEFTMIFEDSGVYASIADKLRKGWNIICECRTDGIRSFGIEKNGKRIELPRYIALKYSGLPHGTYDGFVVKVFEDSRAAENFLDFRRCNVFLPGFDLSYREDLDYQVLPSSVHPEEKYIHITFKEAEKPFTDIVSYEQELDEMLRTPKYCNLSCGQYERSNVSVNGGDTICRLARFIAIYKYYFGEYRGRENAVESFIRDFIRINKSLPEDIEADHLNCDLHMNTFENLILVPGELNGRKGGFVRWFDGKYGVHPVLNGSDEILFAYESINLMTLEPETKFFKCKTFPDFVDWLMLYLGKDPLTEKMQAAFYYGQEEILTPSGMIVNGDVNRRSSKNNIESLTDHIGWRDILLSRPDERYIIHEAREPGQRDAAYTVNLICNMFGCGVPCANNDS